MKKPSGLKAAFTNLIEKLKPDTAPIAFDPSRRKVAAGIGAALITTAIVDPVEAAAKTVRYCTGELPLLGKICTEEVIEAGESDEKDEAPNNKGSGQGYAHNTPAFKYFDAIGRAIEEGRYNGKLSRVTIGYKEKDWGFAFKPSSPDEPFTFDKAKFHEFCRCKGGELPSEAIFEPQWRATLGMIAYHMEECTPPGQDEQVAEIASVYRSEAYNAKVDGAVFSLHKKCAAIDWLSIGNIRAKDAFGSSVAGEIENVHGGVAFYQANKKRGAFFHTDTGRHRDSWRQSTAELKVAGATFQKWQNKLKIAAFTVASCILPDRKDRQYAQVSAQKKPLNKPIHASMDAHTPIARAQNVAYNPAAKPTAPKITITVESTEPATALSQIKPTPVEISQEILNTLQPSPQIPTTLVMNKDAIATTVLEGIGQTSSDPLTAFAPVR